ncbi:glycosyltransferase [Bacteroides fragilis]
MGNVIVNATASRASGALSILKQFLENIPIYNQDIYYIFVAQSVVFESTQHIQFIPIDTCSWMKRIYWDEIGLKRWLAKHHIKASLIISFQNTGVNCASQIPQLIYYHNVIPLLNISWSIWRKDEWLFLIYKYVYPFFVRHSLTENTYIVVQLPSTKEAFMRKFKFPKERLYIVRPDIKNVELIKSSEVRFCDDCFHFIYPATPFLYKNHLDIVYALSALRSIDPSLLKRIKIHFTLNTGELLYLDTEIAKMGLEKNFIFEGTIPFLQLMSYYKSVTALLFPSYLESFGLPLLEAAKVGLPIVVIDLPYAKDVVGTYDGATFVKMHDSVAWAKAIQALCYSKKRYPPFIQQKEKGWPFFFKIIENIKLVDNVIV